MTPALELLVRATREARATRLALAHVDPRHAALLALIVRAHELEAHGTDEERRAHAELMRGEMGGRT